MAGNIAQGMALEQLAVISGNPCRSGPCPKGSGWLFPANPDYRPIELKDGLEYHILGVVLYRIHSC